MLGIPFGGGTSPPLQHPRRRSRPQSNVPSTASGLKAAQRAPHKIARTRPTSIRIKEARQKLIRPLLPWLKKAQ